MLCIVVRELGEGKELEPVVLLVVTKDPEELFQDLVDALCVTVRLRMICCGLVVFDLA